MSFINKNNKKKFRLFPFKMPTAITTLFLITALVIIVSWIPGTTSDWKDDSNTLQKGGPLGVLDVFQAPIQGFMRGADVIVFILVIGGYIGLVMKSGALDAGIGRLVKRLKGKEIWIIPVIMIILSIGGTVEGMCEETIPYYVIIIPALMAAGFDVVTGVLVILLGAGVGVMFSSLNPFAIIVASEASNISPGTGLIWRLVCWILGTMLTIGFVLFYAIRVKKNAAKSVAYHLEAEHKATFTKSGELPDFTLKRKIILTLFAVTFLIMILVIIPWDTLIYGKDNEANGIFHSINNWLIAHFPYITGKISPLGTWKTIELAFLFFFSSIIIALIDWKGEANYVKDFISGSTDLLGVALIIATAGGIGWALQTSGMQAQILNILKGSLSQLPPVLVIIIGYFLYLLLSFLIPSTSGLARASFGIISPIVASLGLQSGMITAYSMASGWINLFAPTAGVMMAGLAIAKVPLTTYYRAVWPFIILITVFCIVMLIIGTLLPQGIF